MPIPLVSLPLAGYSDCRPTPTPPERFYRLHDGRTLGWGGPAWQGHWRYGDAVFPARDPNVSLGEPTDSDGRVLLGGFVHAYPGDSGPPSDRTPTPAQAVLLATMMRAGVGQDVITALPGPGRRTYHAIDAAGWVYWRGLSGNAYLHITAAGIAAHHRAALVRQRRLVRRK